MKTYIQRKSDNKIYSIVNSVCLDYMECSFLTYGLESFNHLVEIGEKISLTNYASRIAQQYATSTKNNSRILKAIHSLQKAHL